jgi:hypothetical protein
MGRPGLIERGASLSNEPPATLHSMGRPEKQLPPSSCEFGGCGRERRRTSPAGVGIALCEQQFYECVTAAADIEIEMRSKIMTSPQVRAFCRKWRPEKNLNEGWTAGDSTYESAVQFSRAIRAEILAELHSPEVRAEIDAAITKWLEENRKNTGS